MSDQSTYDVLVIGSGAAGLTAALTLAETRRVLVLAKGALNSGSTAWAQGGIAAVLDAGDTFEEHIRDTMVAGAGLNRLETVEYVIERAPQAIDRLVELGVPFNTEGADLHLTREGGHSHRRIVHVNDATGWAVQVGAAQGGGGTSQHHAAAEPQLRRPDHRQARGTLFGFGPCVGRLCAQRGDRPCRSAYSPAPRSWRQAGRGASISSRTAPRGATGDGIAMAWRAGARVSNMEMMQFHPTCLYNLEVKNFLITEAVRGEGGHLINPRTGQALHELLRCRADGAGPARHRGPRDRCRRSSASGSITSISISAISRRNS